MECYNYTAFLPPAQRLPRTQHTPSKRARRSCPAMNSSPSPQISRRALLLSVPALSVLLHPATAHAYSSPYKPSLKTETKLPDRRYEDAVNRVITTSSGLQYFDITAGTGAEAEEGSTVFVNYTSRLRGLNGIKIQSTYDEPNTPAFIFRVGGADVVPGVNEAVRGMRVGGKRRAVLPPNIAYQNASMKPAVTEFFAKRRLLSVLNTNRDATIVFDLELIKVK